MKNFSLLSLISTLLMFTGISVFADPPQTLTCGGTVSFSPLDCNGTAHLACGPGGALLYYNMSSCQYYSYSDGSAQLITTDAVVLNINQIYRPKLTRTGDYNGEGTVLTVNTTYNSPQPIPPQPEPPSCRADVVDSTTPGIAVARASCTITMATSVEAYDSNGNLLCQNHQFAALPDTMGVACNFHRDPNHKFGYTVKVYDLNGNRLVDQDGMLDKAPTYNFRPQGNFTNSGLALKPQAQVKKNPFSHGYFWDMTVTAVVSDQDVDPSEGQQLIRVQLVDITTGKVLADRMANSGEQLSFNLEHQEITSGTAHDTNEGLQRGHNVLKLKVYDAYASQNESTVVWPAQELTVDINN